MAPFYCSVLKIYPCRHVLEICLPTLYAWIETHPWPRMALQFHAYPSLFKLTDCRLHCPMLTLSCEGWKFREAALNVKVLDSIWMGTIAWVGTRAEEPNGAHTGTQCQNWCQMPNLWKEAITEDGWIISSFLYSDFLFPIQPASGLSFCLVSDLSLL